MISARLRSTRSAWPCTDQAVPHVAGKRAETVSRGENPPLIPSCEQSRQAERGRQQGSSPVRAATVVAGSIATRACPGRVALNITDTESLMLQRLLERQLTAISQSVAFWKREIAFGQEPTFSIALREQEAVLIKRLYFGLFDINKSNPKLVKTNAYKTAKNAE